MKNKILTFIILSSFYFSSPTFSNISDEKEITKLDLKYENEKYYLIENGELFSGEIEVDDEKSFGKEIYENGERVKATLYYKENKKPYANLNFDVKNKTIVNEFFLKNGEKKVLTAKEDLFEIKNYYANGKLKEVNSATNMKIDLYELFNNENYFVDSEAEENQNFIQTYETYDVNGNLLSREYHNKITKVSEVENSSMKAILGENENIYFYKSGGIERVETLENGWVVAEKIYSEDGRLFKEVEYDYENNPTVYYSRFESDDYYATYEEPIDFHNYIDYDIEIPRKDSDIEESNESEDENKKEEVKKGKIEKELIPIFNEGNLEYEIIEEKYSNGKINYEIKDYNKILGYLTHLSPETLELFNFNKIKKYNEEGNLIYFKDFYVEKGNLVVTRERFKDDGKKLYTLKTKLNIKDLERACTLKERKLKYGDNFSLESNFVSAEYDLIKYDDMEKIKSQHISKDNNYYVEKKFIDGDLDYSIEQKFAKILGDEISSEIIFTSYFKNGNVMAEEKFYGDNFPYAPVERKEFYLDGKLKDERIEKNGVKIRRKYFYNGNLQSEEIKNINSNSSCRKEFFINGVLESEWSFGEKETPHLNEVFYYDNAGTLEYLEKTVLDENGKVVSYIKEKYSGGEVIYSDK